MDTFQEELNIELSSWSSVFIPVVAEKLRKAIEKVDHLRRFVTVYPDKDDILKPFKDTNRKDVKVVILGSGPYFNGNATGKAFACKDDISSVLHRVFNAVDKDHGNNIDKSLDQWSNQGVLLLNSLWSVEADKPGSHEHIGWQYLTACLIKALSSLNKNVVFMFWGREALEYKKFVMNRQNHLMLEAPHPIEAAYAILPWECDHFEKANEFFNNCNVKPIQWN